MTDLWKRFVGFWYCSPFWHPATWVAHFVVGFVLGLAFKEYGAGIALGVYGRKEYVESDSFDNLKLDNYMDFICPVLGGLLGTIL